MFLIIKPGNLFNEVNKLKRAIKNKLND